MATRTARFTKRTIESITPPAKGRLRYRDTENRHLYLLVGTSGAKVFYLIRKVNGKAVYNKLGEFPELTVSEARNRCAEDGAKLASGVTVNAIRADGLTFAELFNDYMQGHARPQKKRWDEDQRKYDTILSCRLGSRLVNDITTESLNAFHKQLGRDRGETLANRVIELIRSVFNYGIQTKKLPIQNPCLGIKYFRERSRDRFLNREELAAFLSALGEEPDPEWRDFFGLSLWTGARKGNVQSMQWDCVDFSTETWRIPGEEFKNGEPFHVVLSAPALEILKRRKLNATSGSRYVFPADTGTGHIVEPRRAWNRLLARAGGGLADVKRTTYKDTKGRKQTRTTIVPKLRIHDLRRTLASWQAATGASLQVIGKTLGHKSVAATQIYSRLNLDPVRASVDTATAAMLAAMKGVDTDD